MKDRSAPAAGLDATDVPVAESAARIADDWSVPVMQEPLYVSDGGLSGVVVFLILAVLLIALAWYLRAPPLPPVAPVEAVPQPQ